MRNLLNVNGEETFIGKNKIVGEHLSDKILGTNLIYKESFTIIVDTDEEIVIDLIKDLFLDRNLIALRDIENYSNISNNKYLHRFSKGVTTLDFNLTCAVDKVPEINRNKKNGLGIQFKRTKLLKRVRVLSVSRDEENPDSSLDFKENYIYIK